MVAMVSLFPQLYRPCSPYFAQPHTPLLRQLYRGGLLTGTCLQPTLMHRYDSEAQPQVSNHSLQTTPPNPNLDRNIQFP